MHKFSIAAGGVGLALVGMVAMGLSHKAAPVAQVHSQPSTLPPFEFRGLKPSITTFSQAAEAGTVAACDALAGDMRCEFKKLSLGDVNTYQDETYAIFVSSKFDSMYLPFDTGNYSRVSEIVSKAYGPPCHTNAATLQNGYGAQIESGETTWCFKEGNLVLREHADGPNSRYEGALSFFTALHKKPVPNVGRNSL